MKLPKKIYVAWKEMDSDEPFLVAYESIKECVDDENPSTLIGEYTLGESRKCKLTVTEAQETQGHQDLSL